MCDDFLANDSGIGCWFVDLPTAELEAWTEVVSLFDEPINGRERILASRSRREISNKQNKKIEIIK